MNKYLLVLGVRVSGYIQYTGIKMIEGHTLDNAFNREFLDKPGTGDWVVMEAYRIISNDLERLI